LAHKVKLLILDEPTAVIAGREVTLLFERLAALKAAGVSILFVSHRLEEIFATCDRVTVLKDGSHVGTLPVDGLTRDRLIAMMVGRELGGLFPPKSGREPGNVAARLRSASILPKVRDASIEIRSGEITALAGMVGAGRTEVALGLFGALPLASGA